MKHPTPKPLAIVTGAARGIGRATAELLSQEGITVAAIDKTVFKGDDNAIHPFQCDIRNGAEVRKTIGKLCKSLGAPTILINNAAIGGPFHRIDEVMDKEFQEIFDTNVKGLFNLCRFVLPLMQSQGFGRVINLASIQGLLGARLSSTYVATKHAVVGYTRAIAAEWGEHGITCNAICPGYIDTEMGIQEKKLKDHRKKVLIRTPTGKLGTPENVAQVIHWMIHPTNHYMNGSIITLDGGITATVGI